MPIKGRLFQTQGRQYLSSIMRCFNGAAGSLRFSHVPLPWDTLSACPAGVLFKVHVSWNVSNCVHRRMSVVLRLRPLDPLGMVCSLFFQKQALKFNQCNAIFFLGRGTFSLSSACAGGLGSSRVGGGMPWRFHVGMEGTDERLSWNDFIHALSLL